MFDALQPHDCSLPGPSVHGILLGRILHGIVHGILCKNTAVGCHSIFQGIFPTQGSNPGLLHCRQIFFFYHLNYEGGPIQHYMQKKGE